MNKYRNKKTTIDGITFDSNREAKRYGELKLMESAGNISNLRIQPSFLLADKIRWNGKTLRKRMYIADFMYKQDGLEIVEDVKGMRTAVYLLKRHLFLAKYPEYEFLEI